MVQGGDGAARRKGKAGKRKTPNGGAPVRKAKHPRRTLAADDEDTAPRPDYASRDLMGTTAAAPAAAATSSSESAATKKPGAEAQSFASLGLKRWIVGNCVKLGMQYPTEIQTMCIPPALAGKNVAGNSKTGTGKTACYCLPILHRLSEDPFGVYALIM